MNEPGTGSEAQKAGNLLWQRRGAGPAIILFAACVALVPQLVRGNSCGHDFDVHLVSWLDCANAWRHGIAYPHWASSPNHGAGEPRFVFYPPLTWMLGAALGLVLSWPLAPVALTFLLLAGTGLATRALAREILDDAPATLAGCAAIFSGFALFTAYERCSFPEFAGGIWLPLIVLFVLRQRCAPGPLFRRAFDGSTAPLALALAGAWLSNLPLGVMAGYLLAGVALLWAVAGRSLAPLLRAAVAIPLGLGLAAVYWLPAAFERNWVDIRQATEDPGYNFESNWLFAHNANPALALHDRILAQVSWIAISMLAITAAGLALAWLRGVLPMGRGAPSRRRWIPLAAIPAAILVLLFPVSRPLWHLLPEMAFLQYPWRWLEAVEAPMAIFFAASVWPSGRRARLAIAAACTLAFLAATAYASTHYFQVCYPEDTVAAVVTAQRAGAGFEGMYEYEPPGSDDASLATHLPDACLTVDPAAVLGRPDPDDAASNPVWSSEERSCLATFSFRNGLQTDPERRQLRAALPQAGFLVLRLLRYPAWRIRLNGQRLTVLPSRGDGLLVVPVPQGNVDLIIDWTTTPDVVAGRWTCLLSLFLLAALAWAELRRAAVRLT